MPGAARTVELREMVGEVWDVLEERQRRLEAAVEGAEWRLVTAQAVCIRSDLARLIVLCNQLGKD